MSQNPSIFERWGRTVYQRRRLILAMPYSSPQGALSPATAFGSDFALTIPDTTSIDTVPASGPPVA
jgi:hypothetical protein